MKGLPLRRWGLIAGVNAQVRSEVPVVVGADCW